MSDITTYLQSLTPTQRQEYTRIKKIVKKLVPQAEEKMSYGILSLTLDGKFLIYYGGFKDHMSIFPPTYRYTEKEPVTETEIIRRVTKRLKELE
jgi:uncharacterized protein YdhG (YjbR/CyaY superfamily)